VKLSVPLAQPCSVCEPMLLEVALDWSAVEVVELCAFGSVLGVLCGVAVWSAGCDAEGVVDCELDELGEV